MYAFTRHINTHARELDFKSNFFLKKKIRIKISMHQFNNRFKIGNINWVEKEMS